MVELHCQIKMKKREKNLFINKIKSKDKVNNFFLFGIAKIYLFILWKWISLPAGGDLKIFYSHNLRLTVIVTRCNTILQYNSATALGTLSPKVFQKLSQSCFQVVKKLSQSFLQVAPNGSQKLCSEGSDSRLKYDIYSLVTQLPCAATRGIRAKRTKKGTPLFTILIDLKS